jgi:uncharacterized membrane protein
MEKQLLRGYFEEVWKTRWVIPVLQQIMVSGILVIGSAVNMTMKITWLEDAFIGHPIKAKEDSLSAGNSHSSRCNWTYN